MEKLTLSDVAKEIATSIAVKQQLLERADLVAAILESAEMIASSLQAGGTIYTCGNGGSACDAMHFAEELVARYKRKRRGLRAMHLMDGSTITCWSNDFEFKTVYARQVDTFCTEKDILVAISTSGASANIWEALKAAKAKNCKVLGLTGTRGQEFADACDRAIMVPYSESSDRIQEAHIMIIHIWCEYLDRVFID